MENRYKTIEILICCLASSFAILHSATESDSINVTRIDDPNENMKADDNNNWDCPEGWIHYSSDDMIACLWRDRQTRTFDEGVFQCRSVNASLVTYPVSGVLNDSDTVPYWSGLATNEYGYSSYWYTKEGRVPVDIDYLRAELRRYNDGRRRCAHFQPFANRLTLDQCHSKYMVICKQEVSACRAGYFGSKCGGKCHCVGEPCSSKPTEDPKDIICKFGCQNNWMGVVCDKEKNYADVNYYCINSPRDNGKYVDIIINTKGVHYRAIYGLATNDTRGDWCNSTIFNTPEYPYELTTIRIHVDDNSIKQMSTGACVGKRLSEQRFSWVISVTEKDGILLEHDLLVNVTCDFNDAEILTVVSNKSSIHGEPLSVNAGPIQDEVILQVIDAYSGETVTEAKFGSTVELEMTYNLQKGSPLKGVLPYNCFASSPDGTNVKQLLDANGCQSPNSPMEPFTLTYMNKIVTPWFYLFSFINQQLITFHCSFELCFTDDCKVGCKVPQRRRRHTQNQKDEERHSTTRTIRVLTSIPAQKSSNDNHNPEYQSGRHASATVGYEVGPFVYLNPVICTLFLLILLIFICMYIAFLRTLRKSVYDIRKEVEIKRSRDKFLHCGCTQQKDRDYIVA